MALNFGVAVAAVEGARLGTDDFGRLGVAVCAEDVIAINPRQIVSRQRSLREAKRNLAWLIKTTVWPN